MKACNAENKKKSKKRNVRTHRNMKTETNKRTKIQKGNEKWKQIYRNI